MSTMELGGYEEVVSTMGGELGSVCAGGTTADARNRAARFEKFYNNVLPFHKSEDGTAQANMGTGTGAGWTPPDELFISPPTSSSQPCPAFPVGLEQGHAIALTQQDVFYQPATALSSTPTSASASTSTTNMDNGCDFSFLHRRPTSSCSQLMKPFQHPSTPSASFDVTNGLATTPRGTMFQDESVDSATPKPTVPPRQLSTSSRPRRSRAGRPGSLATQGSTRSTSLTPTKFASMFANTKRLPLRLPRPPLCLISDPHADLCAHLRRHGMQVEADEFADAGGITTDFALISWIQTSMGGAQRLLNETNTFLETHSEAVKLQLNASQSTAHPAVPTRFDIPASDLNATADENCLTPTHILAVHGTEAEGEEDEARGLLIPCHALMYALQCVSLPAFPTSVGRREGEEQRTLPVVSLRVPRPSEYPTLHRYVYTHDASALLVELLPMKHIARYWDLAKSRHLDPTPSYSSHLSAQPSGSGGLPTPPSSATDALSHLPTPTLFSYAYKIHSAWSNGVAIGLLDSGYWSTLDRAWSLVVGALSIKKARILDMELRGVQMELGKARG